MKAEARVDREKHRRPDPELLFLREEFIQQLPEGAGSHPAHHQREYRPADRRFAKDGHQSHVGVREKRPVFAEIEQKALVAQFFLEEDDVPVVQVKALAVGQQTVREDGEQQQEKREPELAREGGQAGTRGCAGGVYIHYSIISTAEIIQAYPASLQGDYIKKPAGFL